jgi:hypothetical protein
LLAHRPNVREAVLLSAWILAGERSGLLTRIAATGNVSLRADEKLTVFLELEAALCAGGK